ISFKGSYHGSTFAAISLAGNEYNNRAYHPLVQGCLQVTPPDISVKPNNLSVDEWIGECILEVENLIKREGPETICGFITEIIQLSNGVAIIPNEYFVRLRQICDDNDILWVCDEVATGFGRTGKLFAVEHLRVWPEIITMAKGISGGYIPMGGVMVTKEIFEVFYDNGSSGKEFSNGFTAGGHPMACAAASAVLDVMDEKNLIENAKVLGDYLLNELKRLERFSFVNIVQGKGLMIGVKLEPVAIPLMPNWGVAHIVCKFLMRKGVMLYPDGPTNIIIAPPLTSTEDDCKKIYISLNNVLESISKLMKEIN
ncbi:MAG: aspartate aminotransferase family protein, partial [Clostridium sp.]